MENDMPAKSVSQRRLMGQVVAYKEGRLKNASNEIKKASMGLTLKQAKEFASTPEKNLPYKKKTKR